MKRIKSFKLLGHTIKVKYIKKITAPDGSNPVGIYYSEHNTIFVATHALSNIPYPEEFISHTFHHELAHALMLLMGKNDLYQDEVFIDSLGGFLAQYDSTKK